LLINLLFIKNAYFLTRLKCSILVHVTIFIKIYYYFRITLIIVANRTAVLLRKSRVPSPYPLTEPILLTRISLTYTLAEIEIPRQAVILYTNRNNIIILLFLIYNGRTYRIPIIYL